MELQLTYITRNAEIILHVLIVHRRKSTKLDEYTASYKIVNQNNYVN